ncbi:unnamed protein product [Rhodiola kirilowii]
MRIKAVVEELKDELPSVRVLGEARALQSRAMFTSSVPGGSEKPVYSSGGYARAAMFDVISFGARADGKTDDTKAFVAAWKEACQSSGKVNLLVPEGKYLVGPVKFTGPCQNVSSLTLHVKGQLTATTDLSTYGSNAAWIQFGRVTGLTLTGGGTFDGQGSKAWPYNDCPTNINCYLLPTSLKFVATNRTVVRGITSLNSKFFHMAVVECKDFTGSEIRIVAPEDSPNTDGIHVERSSGVYISGSRIGTGDDCISIGQGNSHVTISGIWCGPGHGISVGSLGKYPNERDVSGLVVKDCTVTGTTNGIRIKTWANSPGSSAATNMTFDNIVMNNVTNPIIIDQEYCPFASCASKAPSLVKLSDIYFRNIRGTSSSAAAVILECSKGIPCQNVFLENVNLKFSLGSQRATSTCKNVKATYSGTQVPPPCTSKSVATLRESYSGRSVRKILNWGWGFLSSGESHKIKKAVLGGQSGTSWRNLVQKVRIRVKKILTSNHNVGRPQTCRYNSFDYSKNFDDGCSKSCV